MGKVIVDTFGKYHRGQVDWVFMSTHHPSYSKRFNKQAEFVKRLKVIKQVYYGR